MASSNDIKVPEEAFLAALRALSFGGSTDRKVEARHLHELAESMLSLVGDDPENKHDTSAKLTRGYTAFLDIMMALGGARLDDAQADPSKPVLSDALKQRLALMPVVQPGKANVENTEHHLQAINKCLLEIQSQTSHLFSHLIDLHPYMLALDNAEKQRKEHEKAIKKNQSMDRIVAFFNPFKGPKSKHG